MAKGSIRGKSVGLGYQGANTKTSIPATVSEMRNGPSITRSQKGSLPTSVSKMRAAGPTVTRSMKGDIKAPPAMGSKRIGAVANKYAEAIGPIGRVSVPGGRGIMALGDVRIGPTARAPKATMNATMAAPIKTRIKPTGNSGIVRTTTNMKASPIREKSGGGLFGGKKSSTPQRGTNLGVSSGKTTGKSVSRGGTGGRTTGGGRSTGGGYSNAGPAGMGASGRGTGGKR